MKKRKPNKCSKSGRLYCNNWFTNKFRFQISIENIVLIPNSLGIITYIVGAAAGMKLIKNRLGKIFSIVAFTCCVVVYPFIGGVILIPVAVALICLCYVRFSSRRKEYK